MHNSTQNTDHNIESYTCRNHQDKQLFIHKRKHASNLISKHLNIRFGCSYKKTDNERCRKEDRQVTLFCKLRTASFSYRKNAYINTEQKECKTDYQKNSADKKPHHNIRAERSNRKTKYKFYLLMVQKPRRSTLLPLPALLRATSI